MGFKKKIIKPQAFPMPLWLQSFYAFLRIVLFTWAVIAAPLAVGLAASAHGYANWRQQLKLSGNILLLSCGVPLQIFKERIPLDSMALGTGVPAPGVLGNEAGTPSAETQFIPQGKFSLIPLLMVFMIVILARRAGYSLKCAAPPKRLWQVICGWIVCISGIGILISWFCGTDSVRSNVLSAGLIPLLPTGCGLLWGFVSRKKRWFWWSEHWTTYSDRIKGDGRGFSAYLVSIFKGSGMVLLLVCCISAAVLAIGLCLKWADIANSFQRLDADWVGDTEFFMVQLAYLPNIILMTASWLSGAGFYLGHGTVSAPFQGSEAVVPPMVPILQVVPASNGLLIGCIGLVLFVLAGVAAGRWFWVYAENYSDETFDMRFKARFFSLALSSTVNAVMIAIAAVTILVFLGWMGSGELGFSGVYYGGSLLRFGIYSVTALSSGIFIGQLAVALREYRQLFSCKTGRA